MTTRQQRCNKSIHVNVRQEFEIPAVYLKGGVEEEVQWQAHPRHEGRDEEAWGVLLLP